VLPPKIIFYDCIGQQKPNFMSNDHKKAKTKMHI
jgi:hypothetical protein